MPKAPLPIDEAARLAELRGFDVLDTGAEPEFDDLAKLAATIAGTPVSLVSLVDADRQWFKANVGFNLPETSRDAALCAHTILQSDLMEVPDASVDPRFADNPLVTSGPNIRFYAGAPLVTPDGHAMGSLCVIDTVPRKLTGEQAEALRILGRQAVSLLRLRRAVVDGMRSERLARATIDALSARIAVVDASGRIVTLNQAWQSAAPPEAAAVGADYFALCCADDDQASGESEMVEFGLRDVLEGRRDRFSLEYTDAGTGPGTAARWSVVRASRFDDGAGQARMVVAHEDVTDRHRAAERMRHDARHDALTGLPNRIHFGERVERRIAVAARRVTPFAVLFLDLDRFKIINDSLGHAAGDKLLTTIADRLVQTVRPNDTVARMGGDEFTVLLEDLRAPADAARVAERIRLAVSQVIDYEGHDLLTTASIGIVTSGGDGDRAARYETAKDLIRDADAAMYKAKGAGKDRYAVFDQAMHAEVVDRMQMEADLRRAVERGQLELHYQPILSPTGVKGFEALLRWRHGGRLVGPGHFIPVAEDTGVILQIGGWVLHRACQQLVDWRRAGGPFAGLCMSINVSRRQLVDPGLVGVMRDVLRETGAPPDAVVLEFTEGAMMHDSATATRTLADLKDQTGIGLAIDDFGAGSSSLSCLQRFPIDWLKVDRSFTRNLTHGTREAAVMRTMVTLAHDLGMTVVAEGVESQEQADFLNGVGCNLTQGFLFSRPLDAPAAERFVRDGKPLMSIAA
jgi:diguanylate cyclase (GGDEF)-like protein